MSNLFIDTVLGNTEGCHRPPVWFMRQAGRALQSYRDLKAKHEFKELLRSPELACEVTLLPERSLDIDALILFSDILVVLEAMGIEVNYEMGGPKIIQPLKETKGVLKNDFKPDIFNRVYETISLIKQKSELPLIGFCGGPLTVFFYLFQGSGHLGNFEDALRFFYSEPEKADQLLGEITTMSIQYAEGQMERGIDAFQIFETWAGSIPVDIYYKRVMPQIERLAQAIKNKAENVPVLYFPRLFSNGYYRLKQYAHLFDAVSIDFTTQLSTLQPDMGAITLQGNLDPTFIKSATPRQLTEYLNEYLKYYQANKRWVVNLGHGVLPGTPEENLQLVVRIIKDFKVK